MSRWIPRIHRDVVFAIVALAALLGRGVARADDSYLNQLVAQARTQKLAQDRGWQTLLHYHPTWYGGWKSEADGLRFFNAGRAGRTDPERELEATLVALAGPAVAYDPQRIEETQHPQCRFPARWTFLKRALGIDPARLPDQPCPAFAMWKQAIAGQAVSLVYASAYLNSPASMYGHTFLRVSRATGEGNPLLDYIVNFAADADTDNGFLYAVKGLAGGFRGHFYTMPYYVKIQEYSNMESRDLWDYELALGPEQVERLIAHTWETRSTHFDYYFLSENCSYFLLGLLEAADPTLHLTDQFAAWVIPADTVRAALKVPGLVRRVSPRPSLHAVMMKRKEGLDRREARAADALAKSGSEKAGAITPLPPERQAAVVDAAYDRLRYKEGHREPPSEKFSRIERQLLVLRGRTGVPPTPLTVEASVDAPERGHRSLRVGLGGGVRRTPANEPAGFEELTLRMAIHDHLDAPRGYVEDAVLEMISLKLRFDHDERRFAVDRADFVNIVSPSPLDSWSPKLSWSAHIGGGQERALGCNGWSCLAGGAGAGVGLAVHLGRPLLLYSLFESDAAAGVPFRDRYRVGLGGSAMAVLRLGSFWHTQGGARYIYYFLGDGRRYLSAIIGQAWNFGSRVQLRVLGESAGHYREARGELVLYF